MQWYEVSYKDLYTVLQKKNMIDDAENIEEPKEYQSAINTIIIPTEILSAEETSDSPKSSESEPSKSVIKKTCPPIPQKPVHLKISTSPSNTEQKPSNFRTSTSNDEGKDPCIEF